ncbi:efflux RND transporter periplasmic adaptor subunit [Lachnospiraceae bacterium 46-61]
MLKQKLKNMGIIPVNKRVIVLSVVLILIAGVSGVYAKGFFGSVNKTQTVLPDISVAEKGDLSKRVTASGTTTAADPISIFIELSQEVDKVFAEVGDKVNEGDLLVTYDIEDTQRELNDKLAEANATVENAKISLSELSAPAEGVELLELQSQVVNAEKSIEDIKSQIDSYDIKISQAQIDVDNAKKTMDNYTELLIVGGISQQEYDNAEQAYQKAMDTLTQTENDKTTTELSLQTAELSLQKAKLNLENGQNKTNDVTTVNSIKKQQNTLETAQRNVSSIQYDINKLTSATYSPISGTIIESNAVEGQILTDSTVMMRIADLSNLNVEAYVSEYDIAQIKIGQKVEMTSDGIENKIYTGTVTKIEPTASTQSTMSGSETVVPIIVHMDNPDELMKPGFSLDLEIIVEDLSDVVFVPLSAVGKQKDGSYYVYKINENNVLQKTNVTLGSTNDTSAVIVNGITIGEKVITSPTENMTDGANLADFATTIEQKKTDKNDSILNNMGGSMPKGGGMPPSGGMPNGGGNRSGGGPR